MAVESGGAYVPATNSGTPATERGAGRAKSCPQISQNAPRVGSSHAAHRLGASPSKISDSTRLRSTMGSSSVGSSGGCALLRQTEQLAHRRFVRRRERQSLEVLARDPAELVHVHGCG